MNLLWIAGISVACCCALSVNAQGTQSVMANAAQIPATAPINTKPYSFGYGGRVAAAIKAHIAFPFEIPLETPVAEVTLEVASDGIIKAVYLSKQSGMKAWDKAVLDAIEVTHKLPLDVDGRAPPRMQLVFSAR